MTLAEGVVLLQKLCEAGKCASAGWLIRNVDGSLTLAGMREDGELCETNIIREARERGAKDETHPAPSRG